MANNTRVYFLIANELDSQIPLISFPARIVPKANKQVTIEEKFNTVRYFYPDRPAKEVGYYDGPDEMLHPNFAKRVRNYLRNTRFFGQDWGERRIVICQWVMTLAAIGIMIYFSVVIFGSKK